MDGLLYSSVAKNLSDGLGSFWFPHFSKTMHTFFDQQPPLGFGILALFFTVFGDSIYVERGYCFLTAIITAALIRILWRMTFQRENESEIKNISWLPVLFWITIPVCFWAYSNGVMENTMAIFDLLAIICIVRFFQTKHFLLIISAGILIFLASLTKGIQGLFPLVAFFAGWAAYRGYSFWKMLLYSFVLTLIPVTIYFFLLQNDMTYKSLSAYLNNRVLNSIQNVVEVESRFYLIGRLFLELIPMIALSIIIISIVIWQWFRTNANSCVPFFKAHILFFLLIGISASFPLIVTLEQRGFYLVTSFPYFAIGVAAFSAPYLSTLTMNINVGSRPFKVFRIISVLLFAGALIFSLMQVGKASRDKDTIHDVHLIGSIVPHGDIVGGSPELWQHWSFQEYLIRHYYICVSGQISTANDYVILEVGTNVPDSIHIEKVNIPTIRYHLYKAQR